MLDNVAVKLSGLLTEADRALWSQHDLGPVTEHALGCSGADRTPEAAHFDCAPATPDLPARAPALADAYERHGTTLPATALRLPLRRPAVASVVRGMRNADQATSALQLPTHDVPEVAWDEIAEGTDG